jgi:hypothetical protein
MLIGIGPDADWRAKLLMYGAVKGHLWTLIHTLAETASHRCGRGARLGAARQAK